MILNVYAIRDVKVGYMTPTFDQSDATATRNFGYAVSHFSNNLMTYAPDDFDLYRLGKFDTEAGKLLPLDAPVFVAAGADFDISK